MNSNGVHKHPTCTSFKPRSQDLVYFAFHCTLNPTPLDSIVNQKYLALNFSLNLP